MEVTDRIERRVRECNEAWERGEAASPSALDYVIVADRELASEPNYVGSSEEGRQFVADVLYERLCDGATERDIAEFLAAELRAE